MLTELTTTVFIVIPKAKTPNILGLRRRDDLVVVVGNGGAADRAGGGVGHAAQVVAGVAGDGVETALRRARRRDHPRGRVRDAQVSNVAIKLQNL